MNKVVSNTIVALVMISCVSAANAGDWWQGFIAFDRVIENIGRIWDEEELQRQNRMEQEEEQAFLVRWQAFARAVLDDDQKETQAQAEARFEMTASSVLE